MRSGLVGRAEVLGRVLVGVREDRQGVLFVGEPGVGKTRLLAETLAVLSAEGWYAERFVASAAARGVPFAPLISLLPAGGADRTQQLAGVRRVLAERAGGRPTVVAVDDAHLLDDASLGCLVDLVHHSDVVVVGTARSTEPAPPDLTSLWAGEAVVRIDIEPLDRPATAELARRLLGGLVNDALADQVWDRTRGVPLFVRELLFDARAQRVLVDEGGVWGLRG